MFVCWPSGGWAADASLANARRLLLTGNYAEAEEIYGELAEHRPILSALGLSRCYEAEGNRRKAEAILSRAYKRSPRTAVLAAELARHLMERGRIEEAVRWSDRAIQSDRNCVSARWVRAELLRTSGDIEAATREYKWFIDYYHTHKPIDRADTLRLIGLAAAQYARWNRLSDQFHFLVHGVFPEALDLEPSYWPAHYESGRLFLEKYNGADATKQFHAALAINPNAAEVYVGLAQLALVRYDLERANHWTNRALEIQPDHLDANLARADVHLAIFAPRRAANVLERARRMHPKSEPLLGRLAAAYLLVDGPSAKGVASRLGQIINEVTARNSHAGPFFIALAEGLEKGRKFPDAARYFRVALKVMPQLVGARGKLGMMLMRLGKEDQARTLLESSMKIDPFNVRVSNTLHVLDLLDTYETLETDHFILRFDGNKDRVLARCAANYLENIYPKICQRLDFEPAEKILFEFFNSAKNTDGHEWFSARMVGLPNLHNIGACAGKMVAITSPTSLDQKFNWARVLRHELVHVINFQQTHFNIPHWYTEALAVHMEDEPRSFEWSELLRRRVPQGKVYNLDTINMGFIRPHTSDDWQMAYCQAEVYAEYMIQSSGEDALTKMLTAYRDNFNTDQAIQRVFSMSQEQFEAGYRKHLRNLVSSMTPPHSSAGSLNLEALRKSHARAPRDLDLKARLALAHLAREQHPEARSLIDEVLREQPRHQLATYVKVKLEMAGGWRRGRAQQMLEDCLDPTAPQAEVVKLLAGFNYKAGNYAAAEALYRLGSEHDPTNLNWMKSLAMVYRTSGDEEKLVQALSQIAQADGDNLIVRKKLARLAMDVHDHAAVVRWVNQALNVNVMDGELHRLLADALKAQGRPAAAAESYELAIELLPHRPNLRYKLAKTWIDAGRPERGRGELQRLLDRDPKHEQARELIESLE